jgi:hypothetical protein
MKNIIEKIKSVGWFGLAVGFVVLIIFLLKGGVNFIGNHQDLISTISGIIIGIIVLMILVSMIPRARMFTGTAIVFLTYAWGLLFWLTCLAITFGLWGFVGTFIGVAMFGLGIFATAILAVLFTGQWAAALTLLVTIIIMYGVRALGHWIISKHRNYTVVEVENIDTDDSQLE